MTTHTILSPSSSHRWLHCADSVRVNAAKNDTPSPFADEGTAAHALLEMCKRLDVDPEQFMGVDVARNGHPVNEDMCAAVHHALSYILAWETRFPDGEVHLEQRLHWGKLLKLTEDVSSGTGDVLLVHRTQCVVMDYKHGAGVVVDVENNTQLMLYALGALTSPLAQHLDQALICVVQPRARHADGPVREWAITRKELEQWARRTVAPRARLVLDGSKQREAGDHCRWCAAQGSCRTLKEASMSAAAQAFEPIDPQDPGDISPEELAEVLRVLPMIESWKTAVYAHALGAMLKEHDAIPGWKLVVGRAPPRQWLNDAKVMELCKKNKLDIDAYAPRSLLSPAQLEDLIPYKGRKGKADFRSKYTVHIGRKAPTPHIAPADDPRPTYGPAADFETVPDVQ